MSETFQSHEVNSPCSQMLGNHLCDTSRVTSVKHTNNDESRSLLICLLAKVAMSETFQSHEVNSPCSQMLGNHLCDTSRVTSVKHTNNDESRSSKNYIKDKTDDVNVSNISSLTSFSPFMSVLELSPFLTSSGSPLPTDYVWHEENIPRFVDLYWSLNEHAGIILSTNSEDDDNYNMIPQFDGTSDEMSSSHKKSNQNRIPPIVGQHSDCLQPSRGLPEHQGSRSNPEAQNPLDMSWNTGTAEGDMGAGDIYSPGRRTQQEVSQTWPQQQQCQWLQQQPKMPTLLPSSPAASFQSPTHSSDASPPQLQPQSPAYKSILSNRAHQHPYQSPSHYPYHSPQSSWGFHSSQQPYNSPSASQSYQQFGESCEPSQSAPASKSHQSPTRSEAQSADLLFESPCSSHQSSQGQLYQTNRDPSTYQSSSQSHEMFYSQKPHPCHTPRHDACGSTRSVWESHTYSTHNQEQMDTQNLKSCQNSCVALASCVVKSHLKVHCSSNDMQRLTPDCSFHQSVPHDCMFPQDCGEKPPVNHPFSHSSSTEMAHMSVPALKPKATLHHSVTPMDRQPPINNSVVNHAESSKVSTEKAGIFSSTPVSDQCSIAEPGQLNIRRNKQTAFIKKIIESPTPPMPGRRYRNRVKQGVELLGRSRSTSLSSPGSPMMDLYRCQPQANVKIPEVGQSGVSQPAPHPFSCESRMPSPMHSSDWQCWKEKNFPPGCQWQEWKMPEWQNVDNCEHLSGGSVEPNIVLKGSRFQHTSCSVDNVVSSSNEHNLQQNKMPLFADTRDAFVNNRTQSLQVASPWGHTSASKVKKSEQSPSPIGRHLAPHVDDTLRVRTPPSSVSMGCTSRRDLKDTAPVSILPLQSRTDPAQFRQESISTPAEIASCTGSDVFSDPKLESTRISNSLGSIYFDGGKHSMKNYNRFETTSPSVDFGDRNRESSPAYTVAFQVAPAGVKSVSYPSSAGSRTDNVEVVRMHPGYADSDKSLKMGSDMIKTVKLTEVDLDGYVGDELLPPDVPSNGRAHHLGLDTSAAGVDEHSVNDRERATLSTLNTEFLQYQAAGQNCLNTSQTNAPLAKASRTMNCLSPVNSEWMHQNAVHNVGSCKKEVNFGSVQCEDSQIESTSRVDRFKGISSRHEFSQEGKDRYVDSQLPGNDFGSLRHQLNPKQDSCCVHSVPSSSEDMCCASQKAVCTSHLPHQYHHHHQDHQQQQQSQLDQAPFDELKHRPHPKCPHPGLHMKLYATDQHRIASSLKSMTVSDNPCDDRQNSENTDNSSRCDIQANIACSSSHTAAQRHGPRSTLKQPVPGQQPSARPGSSCGNSTCSQVHTEQSDGIDKLDITRASYTTGLGLLEHSENSSSSSSLAQLGCEEDSNERAHCRLAESDDSEQPGQSSEFLSQSGEQRMKLSSRKNVKALCLTIPKPQSHINSLDLDGMHTCSDETEKNSTCSQRELDSGEGNYRDRCTFRRSRRCSRLEDVSSEAEERHSPRKAKLQSAYSKGPHMLKLKKTRKTAVSLIEGVHYVVVGKFKGDKMMLVKTTKLDVTPARSVNADEYQKMTAKEIVRVVRPGTLHESRMCSRHSKAGNDPCHISKSHSDCSHNPDSECDNLNIDRALTRTQSIPEASLGTSELSSVKDGFQPDRFRLRNESKNIFTTFTKEAGEWRTRLKEDNFFFKFKESFIKHCKGKEHIPDLQLKDQDNIFFEGVKRSSFCNFQQKFLSNIQKLKSGDYSSSSDDEDDVLDETILKKRIGLSCRQLVSQVESRTPPQRPLKLRFSITDGSLGTSHSTVKDSVCSFSDQHNKGKHYLGNSEKAENGQENKWSGNSRLGSYPATDSGLDAIDEGRYNEHQNKSVGWLDRVQQEVEADKDRHLLKEYDSEEYMRSTWRMESVNSSDEINMTQRNIHQQNYLENSILPNNTKDEEAKEDYLKCQMAFFEDISSDSESNDTIIMDTFIGKGHTFQRGTTTLYPSVSVTDSCPDKPAEIMYTPTEKSSSSTGSDKSKLQRLIEHSSPRCDTMEQPEVCESKQWEAQICAIGNEHGPLSETLASKLTQASDPSVFTQVFKLNIQQKDTSIVVENNSTSAEDMLHSTQGSFVDQGQSFSASMGNSTAKSKITHSSGSEIVCMPTEPRSGSESMLFTKTHNKKRRRRKAVKKMKQVQATKERQTLEDGNNSCQDEVDVSVEPDCHSKCLPERKKDYTYDEVDVSVEPDCQSKCLPERKKDYTYDEVDVSVAPDSQSRSLAERKKTYTYFAELLDSDDDVSSDSSDEDFTVCSSQRKALTGNRKSKGRNFEERPTRKLPKINIDSGRATKRGHKTSSSRGRKKKATGGDKLLNSLSILHMATLANLTEVPSDLPDHQSVSEAAKYGHTLYYTDNSSSAPDEMFPYSSQHSQEEDPPTGSNKRWKHSRKRKCARENTTLSKKLLKKQTNLKYGHNVTSDIGQNPVSLSRLVNNFSSSSPVPSNFTFNHSSDVSCQLEAANLCEDAGTNITLQLLETRRAQVNCASFSMKDILKLTTPDDSMDSDSRDSSVLVRLSASKKAQVKSTALSMSDILKLTNVNSHGETEQIPASGHMLTSLLPTAELPTAHPSVETEARVPFPSSQSSMEAVGTFCAGLREAAGSVSTTSHTQTSSSELSGSVRSHLKQFNSDPRLLHITDTESAKTEHPQSTDSQKPVAKQRAKDFSIEPVSCVPVEGRTSWVQVERKPRKKSIPSSDPVQVNTVEITCSPGSKVKALDTGCCLDGRNNKYAENDSEFKSSVNRLENSHKRLEISSSACASSPILHGSSDVKSASETMSISSSLSSVVKEAKHTTSLSNLSHSSHSTSKGHRDREQVDSDNVVISQRVGVTTAAGDSSQVTGPSSPSVSPVEEFDQLNYDAIPTVPSQIVLEASVPGTSVSPVVKTARLSGTSSRAFCNQKVSCSSSEPSSSFSKQENKGNQKSVNVRNIDRGIKPLHPLQIPHYSSVDQNQPRVEHAPHNAKNSSLYYPHCWQWPVHTPGSDSTASPLNLCTSHKSPNNYSPITPTSPVSPDYPTQAQGVTEFDKSPRIAEGKPLWYPWLKVESGKVETRVSNAQSSHYSNEEFKIHTLRNTRLLPVQQSEQEETSIVFREPAQVDPQKVKPDVKSTSELPKQSPSKNKDQLNCTSASRFVKPRGALLSTEPSPETAIVAPCVTGGESLPSTSCSEDNRG